MADFQFKITPWKEDGEIEPESQCAVLLSFTVQPPFEIKVQRSLAQVQALARDLRSDTPKTDESCGSTDSETSSVELSLPQLELALNKLASENVQLIEEPWNCQALMVFLDNAPVPSFLNSTTFVLMKNKIKSLDFSCKRSLLMVEDLQTKYSDLAQQVQVIQQMMQIQHQQHQLSVHPSPTQHPASVQSVPGSAPSASAPPAPASSPDMSHPETGSYQSSDSDSADPFVNKLPELAVPQAPSAFEGNGDASAPSDKTNQSISPLSHAESRFNASAPEFSPSSSAKSVLTKTSSFANGVLPSSQYLPSSAYAQISDEDPLNPFLEELIVAISPQQAQVHYRDSVVALLQKNFRGVLNCEALEVGLHRLLCFLPDDPIKVSAVVCRNHSTKWHRVICDRLNLVAKRKSEELAGEGYTYRSDRSEEGMDDSSGDHVIRNVVISNTKLNILVQCSIDNLDVELTCNSRSEVCMLALLEEISGLVGKDDLFKQSLQIIRAWWAYECTAYVGTSIKYYLSDFALCLMVAAIFNQHHAKLNTPLQALCAFLAEYSAYDGTVSAITLMGVVPFKSATSNQPVLPHQLHPALAQPGTPTNPSAGGYLLGPDVLERYWLLFCPPDASNPEQQQLKIFSALSSSSEDVVGVDLSNGIVNTNFNVDPLSPGPSSATSGSNSSSAGTEDLNAPSLEEAALAAHRQACARNLAKFDRSQFNIVDPFTCNNMLVERPSQNRIVRLVKVFQTGAQQMATVLNLLQQRQGSSPRDAVAAFFPATTGRFLESLVRPDTFNIDNTFISPAQFSQMTRKIPMKVSIEDLARQMRYCNLMVESVISRSAVLDLVVEILTQKGPLPIGEVGKALAELTCITGLSSRLKEAYGGLKKFLEDFSSVVIIGSDHPFNPHIVLRSSLSAENLAINDSGVFPTNAVLRMKKITATSLRKTSFSNKPVPQLGMGGMGVPQHPVYRPNGPNSLAGVGIGGMMDNRGHQVNRHGMNPPPFSSYIQQGQGQMQQQQHGNTQYTYNAKILSNLHADARDRESASGARAHAIQGSVYSGAGQSQGQGQMSIDRKPSLDRHHSGGSNPGGGGAYGGFAEAQNGGTYASGSGNSVGSNEVYDDVLGGYHQQQGPADPYHQRSPQQQYHDPSADSLRMRVPSYPYPSPPNSGRPGPQGQGQGQGYGQQQQQQRDHMGFAQQRGDFHSLQHNTQGGGQGRGDFNFDQQQQRHAPSSALYNPAPNNAGGSVRDRDYPPSPGASSVGGYAIDSSYFDSSAAPLNDSFSQSGPGSRPSSIRSSFGSSGLPARFDDPLDTPLFQNLQSVGGGNSGGGGARSLLSGLREGTVELMSGGEGNRDREWDPNTFQQSQNGSPDWRGGGGGKY